MRDQILAFVVLVVACDSSGPTSSPPEPPPTVQPTAADACRSYLAAYCARLVDCHPDEQRTRAVQLDACEAQLQSDGGDCARAVGVSDQLGRCLDDLAAASCAIFGTTVPDSCRGVVRFPP